jgi:excisionase family DNA binding protein
MTKEVATLTVRQAAVQFGYTIPYLYSLLHMERIPGAYRVDGEWRLPLAALKEHQTKRGRRTKPVPGQRTQSNQSVTAVAA